MKSKNLKHNINMNDIARIAGVSKSAVSKALNYKADISKKMREHIFKVCEDVGYRINFRIQDMIKERQTGMTHNIAFVIIGIDFSDPSYSKILDGIAKGVNENNLRLLLEYLTGEEKSIYDLPPVLRDGRVDGFIVTGKLNEKMISVFKKLDIPYVILGTYEDFLIKDSVNISIDLADIMFKTIKEFKNNNCKKIAYFTENPDNFFEKELLAYFKIAMTKKHLQFNSKLIYLGTGPLSGSFANMKNIFENKELPFDSIVCFDFRIAQEISHLAYAHTKQYSSSPITIATTKVLSHYRLFVPSVYYDYQLVEIAYKSVQTLINIISGKIEDSPKIILDAPQVYLEKA